MNNKENDRHKNKKIGYREIVYSVIAVLVFVILFFAVIYVRDKQKDRTEVSIVMLGDSLVGKCRDESSISASLAGILETEVFNGAMGGTSAARLDEERRLADTRETLCLYALAQSIACEDFGVQQTARIREPATEYFESTIDQLAAIDFEAVDILFISHGVNDYHGGVPVYDEEDPYNEYTFTGALRSSIELLREKYPEMRIILLTPTYTWYIFYDTPEMTCEENDLGGGVLEDYVNAELELAREMGVEVIDLYHDFYSHKQWSDWQIYTEDGVHPNETGRAMIVEKIYEYLTNE